MAFELKKAKRSLAYLKLGIAGPSGSGKTLSSLLMAYGLLKEEYPNSTDAEIWDKICVIDTENRSASLYVGNVIHGITLGEYYAIDLTPPFTPQSYMDAIEACEQGGIKVLIIDSLSHAWSGEGGMLDMQGKVASRTGNSYTAWRDVTPLHNRLVDKILQCDMHVILAMRTKAEYVIETNDKGKQAPRKIGLAPIFRDGVEYECTVFFELAQDHTASATKDRTMEFDQQIFVVTPDTGKKLYRWLNEGEPQHSTPIQKNPPMQKAEIQSSEPEDKVLEKEVIVSDDVFDDIIAVSQEELTQLIDNLIAGKSREEKAEIANKIKAVNNGSANYKNIPDYNIRNTLYEMFS